MLDNLTLVALLIIVVWVATLAYYFYVSRQQTEIREELEGLQKLMDQEEREG